MTQALRSLLFCLMMLALPLQGFAQAGMLACHTGAGSTQSMDHHAQVEHGEHEHADHSTSTEFQSDEGQTVCCACGPSCGVLALQVQASTPVWVQHDVFAESHTNHPFPSTSSRRIDRPPKLILA